MIPKSSSDLQGGMSARNRYLFRFEGGVMRNPKTVLVIAGATTNGENQKKRREAPDYPSWGQILKLCGDVGNGS